MTAQLTDAADGRQVWGDTFEKPMTDLFDLESDCVHHHTHTIPAAIARSGEQPVNAIAKASFAMNFAMNFAVIDAGLVVKLLLLLLIGMGPKVALVPFLEKTKHLDAETQRAVGRRMVVTAVVTAIVLFATGWLLLRLLHVSGGAVAVGGAIGLAILAINMAAGPTKKVEEVVEIREDPKQIAVYPLAVPYLLNPVGITILIIASGEIVSVSSAALVLGLVLPVGAVDYLVFANIDRCPSA